MKHCIVSASGGVGVVSGVVDETDWVEGWSTKLGVYEFVSRSDIGSGICFCFEIVCIIPFDLVSFLNSYMCPGSLKPGLLVHNQSWHSHDYIKCGEKQRLIKQ